MKKFLRFLAFILLASAIPGIGMAATNYGIFVAGTQVTSDNANNFKDSDITSGTVTYNASTNTLTLNNVTMASSSSGINVSSSAPDHLRIVLEGNNLFKKVQGAAVAFVIYKSSKATSSSSVNCYIQGSGTLTLEESTIMCMDAPWICIGNGVQGGEGKGGLTVNAQAIYCRSNSGNGIFSLTDGCVNLSGFSYGTVYGFRAFYAHDTDLDIYSPVGASYNTTDMYLRDSSGQKITGPVYMGWKKYGLRLCGTEVTAGNCNNIQVNPDARQTSGTYTFYPGSSSLKMTNARLDNFGASVNCLENDIPGLVIFYEGDCEIIEQRGLRAIYSTENISLSHSGSSTLRVYSSSGKAIEMGAEAKVLGIYGGSVKVDYGGIHCNNGGVYVQNAAFEVVGSGTNGGIRDFAQFRVSRSTLTTPGVYYDPLDKVFRRKNYPTETYTGDITYAAAQEDYGIEVCGVEVTEHNCDNVVAPFIENGTIRYDKDNNVLTLNNVRIDAKNCPSLPALQFHSNAHTHMQIMLEGKNLIRNTNGVAIMFNKPADGEISNPIIDVLAYQHYDINGTGWLTVEGSGIRCIDGARLAFGGWLGKEGHGGCTVNADFIDQLPKGGGGIYFNDCMVTLNGYNSGTISGFKTCNVTAASIIDQPAIHTPQGARYDTDGYFLADADGNMVTGETYIGWKKYGLRVCGIEINSQNKDDIRDVLNDSPTIIPFGGGDLPEGSLKYDPATGTLTMKNVALREEDTDYAIENTGSKLTFSCTGEKNAVISSFSSKGAIYTTQSLEFRGRLDVGAYSGDVIVVDGEGTQLDFNYCNVELATVDDGHSIYASPKNRYRLKMQKSDIKIANAITGIDCYEMSGMGITTPQVFIKPYSDTCPGCFYKAGEGEYTGEVTFQAATKDYGIRVSGHEVNNVNYDNFYFDDITSGTVTYDPNTHFLWLNNVTSNCTWRRYIGGVVKDWHPNGINIGSNAPDDVRIIFNGNNTFSNIDGVGIVAEKNIRFEGWGHVDDDVLDMGKHSIAIYNGSNIEFRDGGTVKASRLYGSEGNGGDVLVIESSLYLSGDGSYPTLRGIKELYIDGAQVITPENHTFTDGVLQVDSQDYKGEVAIVGIKPYNIMIGDKMITNLNKDDVLGDGTVSFEPDGNTGILYLDNAQISDITIISSDPFNDVVINLKGTSTIQAKYIAVYTEIPVSFTSDDGKGKLVMNAETGDGIWLCSGTSCRISDCQVEINARVNGIEGQYKESATGTSDDLAYIFYPDLTLANSIYKTRLTINTKEYGGEYNLKNIELNLEGGDYGYEIRQPVNAVYDSRTGQITDVSGTPLYQDILEIVLFGNAISLDDITDLIERYLQPGSDIQLDEITDLIDQYLEQ
ncbi:MAG: hypothetical protein IJT97_04985 [Bacteroidaceae bacterium]|nr:hypothetical protein [Bacteroidaceae bacterium]